MHDQALAYDAIARIRIQRNLAAGQVDGGIAIGVSGQVAKVAVMVFCMTGSTMFLAFRIEVAAGAHAVRRAAITFFMDVEAMQARRQAGNACADQDFVSTLLESHCAVGGICLLYTSPSPRD